MTVRYHKGEYYTRDWNYCVGDDHGYVNGYKAAMEAFWDVLELNYTSEELTSQMKADIEAYTGEEYNETVG